MSNDRPGRQADRFRNWSLVVMIVITALGWAVNFGMMRQRMDDQDRRINEQEQDIRFLMEMHTRFIRVEVRLEQNTRQMSRLTNKLESYLDSQIIQRQP